mgnify:CR=1 FL=1|jgi:hypothetical protein
MEALTPVVGICVAVGCAFGGITTAYDNFRYERALEDPSFLYLVDEVGNPVSQELE